MGGRIGDGERRSGVEVERFEGAMDGGIREIDSNGEVIAPAIFFMERFDVVARASGKENGRGFLGGILCPIADGSVASDRGDFGLRGGGIGGAEPEL